MEVKNVIKRCMLSIFLMNLSIVVFAQAISAETVEMAIELKSETTVLLKSVTNNSGCDINIIINGPTIKDNKTEIKIGERIDFSPVVECSNISVVTTDNTEQRVFWSKGKIKKEWDRINQSKLVVGSNNNVDNDADDEPTVIKEVKDSSPSKLVVKKKIKKNNEEVIKFLIEEIEKDSYWSTASLENERVYIDEHIEAITDWAHNKKEYISHKKLNQYIQYEGRIIEKNKIGIDSITDIFLSRYTSKYKIENESICRDSIKCILLKRLSIREMSIEDLKAIIDSVDNKKSFDIATLDKNLLIEIVALVLAVCVLIIWFSVLAKRKKNKHMKAEIQQTLANDPSPVIVVRKKTASILKKQSLEGVVGNKAYLKIECMDFCNDSAVKQMYIKNTCIKEIYNMYADDLRNPNNPKEDGCMVLGRWIHDEQSKEYSISLEEIVRPGDDAVFQEYELNFGGKIKLRVAERLRKLRNETNLQYDLTCWVHSHPGLGVFFSNSDTIVQMQLKHPSHPNFLTAIVVDILTPQQEFGIFTFKHDSSINSRNDLKKMYSLEELHKWAIESDRNSYKPEDYYNVLSKAQNKNDACQGILLSNGAIIDISSFVTEQTTGLMGWVHGFKTQSREKKEFVVNSVSKAVDIADNEQLGCLIIGTHCSIPSIRKTISECANKIKFVMFYSNKDETITTIPVIDAQLSMDETFYSEEKLEDLKIWTRRKR